MEAYGWQPVSDLVLEYGTLNPAEVFAFDKTPQNPNAPYAVAKVAVERYLEYAGRSYGLPWCAMRTTNCYGRWDNTFFVTESIISQMVSKDEINLGYSEPYRNFIHIDDLSYLYKRLIDAPYAAKQLGCFTIGPNNPIKMCDYAELIAPKNKFHWKDKLEYKTTQTWRGLLSFIYV